MIIAIADANVVIDLFHIGALPLFLVSSCFEVHLTDLVVEELQDEGLQDLLSGAAVHTLSETDLIEAVQLGAEHVLSLADSSCIVLARGLHCRTILSGDKKLKAKVAALGIDVRGTLYVLEKLHTYHQISTAQCLEYLEQLVQTNVRIPSEGISSLRQKLTATRLN
ncbi:MAG: hypothetical protein IJ228_01515 [Succinivibrio sp.]|nr:hypothetical protein [Succinivibrio sp.]